MTNKAIIIDDEENLRSLLASKLQKLCPSISVIGEADNAQSGYELILELKPDVVFLDVEMPNETGFDLLRRFDTLDFEVIFVTGYDSYAIDAITFCAIGYVLKPIEDQKLIDAVANLNKRKETVEDSSATQGYKVLLSNALEQNPKNHQIAIPTMSGIDFIKVNQIVRVEGVNKYSSIRLKDATQIISSYSIGVYKSLLSNYGFYMPHKSHLVNLSCLKKYTKDGTLLMSDDSHVPVSTRKRREFLELIKSI